MHPPYPDAIVPCGPCVACCQHVAIDLYPPQDDPTQFVTQTDSNGRVTLARQADGSCHYLQDKQCTIYERRPATCRSFDCRVLLATDVRRPLHVWRAASELFELTAKAPGDADLLATIRTKARLIEARAPNTSPAIVVREALRP